MHHIAASLTLMAVFAGDSGALNARPIAGRRIIACCTWVYHGLCEDGDIEQSPD
jgi:hypothetical protein